MEEEENPKSASSSLPSSLVGERIITVWSCILVDVRVALPIASVSLPLGHFTLNVVHVVLLVASYLLMVFHLT
jgi:hypothetical protein